MSAGAMTVEQAERLRVQLEREAERERERRALTLEQLTALAKAGQSPSKDDDE